MVEEEGVVSARIDVNHVVTGFLLDDQMVVDKSSFSLALKAGVREMTLLQEEVKSLVSTKKEEAKKEAKEIRELWAMKLREAAKARNAKRQTEWEKANRPTSRIIRGSLVLSCRGSKVIGWLNKDRTGIFWPTFEGQPRNFKLRGTSLQLWFGTEWISISPESVHSWTRELVAEKVRYEASRAKNSFREEESEVERETREAKQLRLADRQRSSRKTFDVASTGSAKRKRTCRGKKGKSSSVKRHPEEMSQTPKFSKKEQKEKARQAQSRRRS